MKKMEVIGEKLKTSREEKGLSLDEVSEDLNIPVKDLDNIEKGNRNAFSDIYILKKDIYDYAKYLGLDYEDLIEEFNEYMFVYTSKIPTDVIERISKQKEKEEEKKGALSPYTMTNNKKFSKKWIIIIIVLLLAITTAIVVITNNNNKKSNEIALASLI